MLLLATGSRDLVLRSNSRQRLFVLNVGSAMVRHADDMRLSVPTIPNSVRMSLSVAVGIDTGQMTGTFATLVVPSDLTVPE